MTKQLKNIIGDEIIQFRECQHGGLFGHLWSEEPEAQIKTKCKKICKCTTYEVQHSNFSKQCYTECILKNTMSKLLEYRRIQKTSGEQWTLNVFNPHLFLDNKSKHDKKLFLQQRVPSKDIPNNKEYIPIKHQSFPFLSLLTIPINNFKIDILDREELIQQTKVKRKSINPQRSIQPFFH